MFRRPDIERIRHTLARRERKVVSNPQNPPAAVLVALCEADRDYDVIFTLRTDKVEHHKGEISFPGGACDDGDGSPEFTALRESFEEVGLPPEDVTVLGRLDDFVTRSRFRVTPIVGYVARRPDFQVSEAEVAELLQVPLSHLLAPSCYVPDPRDVANPQRTFPCYLFREHVIYGATALMLTSFLDLIRPA